jgi:NAD(P)-dependent dehydrogenase (short-subunit alcohol dehydrogenase family)
MKLEGKEAIVTGAGSGIGRAVSIALAGRGAPVFLFGRRRDKLVETARLVEQRRGSAEIVVGDVADEDARRTALNAAQRRFGRIDILVNNAGNVRGGRLDRIEVSEIRAMIEVDCLHRSYSPAKHCRRCARAARLPSSTSHRESRLSAPRSIPPTLRSRRGWRASGRRCGGSCLARAYTSSRSTPAQRTRR